MVPRRTSDAHGPSRPTPTIQQPVDLYPAPPSNDIVSTAPGLGDWRAAGMAMGMRRRERQETLFIATDRLPRAAGHPFYEQLNHLLAETGFDS
jgi:hypothetical protein